METVIVSPSLNLSSWEEDIFYPDSDGKPMANNTEHLEWIAATKYGLEAIFADREDVVVAADLFWYPVKGKTHLAVAPDVMVILGRPKAKRKSYRQWNEDNIAPQVVFEFLSDSNTTAEMTAKAIFFERHGVQEYYVYDLETKELSGFIRYTEEDDQLEELSEIEGWKSPRLGITFDISSGELVLRKPDGTPFLKYEDYIYLEQTLDETKAELGEAKAELTAAKQREEALAAKLRELGINPDAL